jgi:hypothetical protein
MTDCVLGSGEDSTQDGEGARDLKSRGGNMLLLVSNLYVVRCKDWEAIVITYLAIK